MLSAPIGLFGLLCHSNGLLLADEKENAQAQKLVSLLKTIRKNKQQSP
jgi:hypothetical protein